MGRSIALLSSARISNDDLGKVMKYLNAGPDPYGWVLERQGRQVFVEPANDNLDLLPDDMMYDVVKLLNATARTMIVAIFNDDDDDSLEWSMAKAVGMALSEQWPIVLHDYANPPERLYPPSENPNPRRKRAE